MTENNNNKIVSITVELKGKKKKYTSTKIEEVPTSYKTLITLPVICETEVDGKTIVDDSLYDYTVNRIKDKFSRENVGYTLLTLYSSHKGALRSEGEKGLMDKLETRGMFQFGKGWDSSVSSKVEIYYGRYNGKSRFDKVSCESTLNKNLTSYTWLRVLDFENKENQKKVYEDYTNLIWNVWNKHIDGSIKDYPVYISTERDYQSVKYAIPMGKRFHNVEDENWKPKKVITGTIKGITKFDAIQKYNNDETDIENIKYVSINEVPKDSIQLGEVKLISSSIKSNKIPKESELLSNNQTKEEKIKEFVIPDGCKEGHYESKS